MRNIVVNSHSEAWVSFVASSGANVQRALSYIRFRLRPHVKVQYKNLCKSDLKQDVKHYTPGGKTV